MSQKDTRFVSMIELALLFTDPPKKVSTGSFGRQLDAGTGRI
jgi:hypothetical protein